MISLSDYERAVHRYARVVLTAAISAFALFVAIDWLEILLLSPYDAEIRQWAQASHPVTKAFTATAMFLAGAPIALLFLVVIIRRARRKSILHCPDCATFIGSVDSMKHVRHSGRCPHCLSQLVPESELTADARIAKGSPSWPFGLIFSVVGVGLVIYAIPQPLPDQGVLAFTALINFATGAYLVVKKPSKTDEKGIR